MNKLYIVVRADLLPGAQLAQSCHAVSLFAEEYPELHKHWAQNSNNIVCVSTPTKESLLNLVYKSVRSFDPVSVFKEPDFDNEPTAAAFTDSSRRLLSNLPLALKQKRSSSAHGGLDGDGQLLRGSSGDSDHLVRCSA